MASNVVSFQKMGPNVYRETSKDHFLKVTPKKGRRKLRDNFLGKFGKICAKILCTPKNLLAPTPVLFNLFVIVEPLIYFRVCHGTPIKKN